MARSLPATVQHRLAAVLHGLAGKHCCHEAMHETPHLDVRLSLVADIAATESRPTLWPQKWQSTVVHRRTLQHCHAAPEQMGSLDAAVNWVRLHWVQEAGVVHHLAGPQSSPDAADADEICLHWMQEGGGGRSGHDAAVLPPQHRGVPGGLLQQQGREIVHRAGVHAARRPAQRHPCPVRAHHFDLHWAEPSKGALTSFSGGCSTLCQSYAAMRPAQEHPRAVSARDFLVRPLPFSRASCGGVHAQKTQCQAC